tara:strand:+ start:562 stop:741 length:180 start_codon:yes stop_codon:yes gene_type:complete
MITGSSKIKVKKIVGKLEKASKAHAKQAKTLKKLVNKNNGGMIKGYSPIARPQRFRGIF